MILITKWFKGKELGLAMSFNITLTRLGSSLTCWTMPVLYNAKNASFAVSSGFAIAMFCLGCAAIATIIDRMADESKP